MNITLSISWRREEVNKTSHHQSPGGERKYTKHHTIDLLEERGVERVSAQDDLQREIEPSLVKTNIEIIFNSNVRKILTDKMEHIWAFPGT